MQILDLWDGIQLASHFAFQLANYSNASNFSKTKAAFLTLCRQKIIERNLFCSAMTEKHYGYGVGPLVPRGKPKPKYHFK